MSTDKLEIETSFGKCKCCLKNGYLKAMWEESEVDGEIEVYGEMLLQCFSISSKQNRSEEDQICEDCIWKLREANNFRKQLEKSLNTDEVENAADKNMSENDIEIKDEPEDEYNIEYLEDDILEGQNNNLNDNSSDVETHDKEHNKVIYPDNDSLDDSQETGSREGDDMNFSDDGEYIIDPDGDKDNEELEDDPTPRKRAHQKNEDIDPDAPKPKWSKKQTKEERFQTYRQYTEEALENAVEAVLSKSMNQKEACKKYQVPRKCLSVKITHIRREMANLESQRPDPELIERDPEPKRPLTQNCGETAVPENMVLLIKHRENIGSILAHSNATPIRGCLNVGYVCVYCPEHYKDPTQLKKHTLAIHTTEKYLVKHVRTHSVKLDITGLKCSICKTKIGELEALMRHLKQKHKKPMHFDIDNHVVPYRFEKGVLKCVKCAKIYNNFKNLSMHMIDVHFRNHLCPKCPRGFVNKCSLLHHLMRHRQGEFPCSYCKKTYTTRNRKTDHERIQHVHQGKPRKCSYCDERFLDTSQKIKHEMMYHKEKQRAYVCSVCDKTYRSKTNLELHSQKVHLNLRPFRCTEAGCDKTFTAKYELENHRVAHKDDRPFSCELCPKNYKTSKSLYEHMYSHNAKGRFKCPKCRKKFVFKENMALHLKKVHDKKVS